MPKNTSYVIRFQESDQVKMTAEKSSQELRNVTEHTLAMATSPSKEPWQQNKHQRWTWWPDKNWVNSSKNNNGKIHLQMDTAEDQDEYFWKSSNVIAPGLSYHTELMLAIQLLYTGNLSLTAYDTEKHLFYQQCESTWWLL